MRRALPLSLLLLALVLPLRAQVRPVYDTGADGLVQLVERLRTTASALHTGAHPDDEDSALLARLARGDHARVAYLALNRGEGGQNAIGPEQGDALGVIRTEELLQARRLDGAGQFFTRVRDFGYTRSRAETAARWQGDAIALGDMVRVIRLFRPLVVIARFTGTPADEHGNHQFSGYLTPLAVRQASDPAAFPDQIAEGLRPWSPWKFYVSESFVPNPQNEPTLRLPVGLFDPVLGRSYVEIAIEGRSLHRTQEQGYLELRGPQTSGVRLVESRVATTAAEASIFDGIDTSLRGLAVLAGLPDGALAGPLGDAQSAAERARTGFDVREPERRVKDIADGLRAIRSARAAVGGISASESAQAEAQFLLAQKERDFTQALVRAAGVELDPLVDQETLAPGESAAVWVRAFLAHPDLVTARAPSLEPQGDLEVAPALEPSPAPATAGDPRRRTEAPDVSTSFRVTVGKAAMPTVPYWLELPRDGEIFAWPGDDRRGRPFGPSLLEATLPLEIAGVDVRARAPVMFRSVDAVRGELRREPNVVPALSVALGDDLVLFPVSPRPTPRHLSVYLTAHAASPVEGRVRLEAPAGFKVTPPDAAFRLAGREERTAVAFTVEAPPGAPAGAHALTAHATVDGSDFASGVRVLAYPHIQTHRILRPASATARVLDLRVAPVRVGYVMGSGDRVPEAIARMGLAVTELDEDALTTGDLSRFDVIVAGVLAAKARPDFVANHGRLLDWVRAGGTLIVQYQRPAYAERGLPPFPVKAGGRVNDETAVMKVLHPEDPVFTFPNRIGAADWEGWVQERSVSDLNAADEHWRALLEAHDEGDPPQQGLLIEAAVGKGVYFYSAVAFFRQLPAGVPGAYRLFANLLSRPKAPAR